ncbi:hypothetical protein OC846_002687 [Tilletia horrida]|uniref:Uncharacterized protein n=1 Tax=Tilletia horrida TaxID=155126 RepID=A0AAN6JUN4_9BASI|nr:hypothetical protein OC846_002687 [Tilletia horrida]KAK0566252.1 hypothetical protein OC861_003331 [Tilletia horrida]
MSLVKQAYCITASPVPIQVEDVLRRTYTSSLWLGESHTPLISFLHSFSSSSPHSVVLIKHDQATIRSARTYPKQLRPLFNLLRSAEQIEHRHESPSTALEDIDLDVLSTLSVAVYSPPKDIRRQYHAREIQLQLILILFLLQYLTLYPPPPECPPFTNHSPNSATSSQTDAIFLNEQYRKLVEQLSRLQLRALVPELGFGIEESRSRDQGSQGQDGLQQAALYIRPPSTDTPSKHQPLLHHPPPPPRPTLIALPKLMAHFYNPILQPHFTDTLPSQLAVFRDRCGNYNVSETVWASDSEASPVHPAATSITMTTTAIKLEPAEDTMMDYALSPPPSPISMHQHQPKLQASQQQQPKKKRKIALGTPDLAPEKKRGLTASGYEQPQLLLTRMIGGRKEISMDSRTFTRSNSIGTTNPSTTIEVNTESTMMPPPPVPSAIASVKAVSNEEGVAAVHEIVLTTREGSATSTAIDPVSTVATVTTTVASVDAAPGTIASANLATTTLTMGRHTQTKKRSAFTTSSTGTAAAPAQLVARKKRCIVALSDEEADEESEGKADAKQRGQRQGSPVLAKSRKNAPTVPLGPPSLFVLMGGSSGGSQMEGEELPPLPPPSSAVSARSGDGNLKSRSSSQQQEDSRSASDHLSWTTSKAQKPSSSKDSVPSADGLPPLPVRENPFKRRGMTASTSAVPSATSTAGLSQNAHLAPNLAAQRKEDVGTGFHPVNAATAKRKNPFSSSARAGAASAKGGASPVEAKSAFRRVQSVGSGPFAAGNKAQAADENDE